MVWSTERLDIFTDNWAGVLGKSQSILSFISVKNQPNQNVFFVRLQHNMRHNHCWHSHTSLKKVKCSGEILKLEIKTSLNLIYKLRNFPGECRKPNAQISISFPNETNHPVRLIKKMANIKFKSLFEV